VGDVVVVGVGNPDRGDDAVGPGVVAHLEGVVPSGVRLLHTAGSDPGTILDAWRDADAAILVDAMVSGGSPGTVERFDAADAPLPSSVRLASTHALGAQTAVEMGRALGVLPRRLTVFGVEAVAFEHGASMTPEVAAAIDVAGGMILEEIAMDVGSG
jgi:hydrogenase maturation protease